MAPSTLTFQDVVSSEEESFDLFTAAPVVVGARMKHHALYQSRLAG